MKDKINTIIFLGFIFTFSILHILLPDYEISNTERRKLSTFPKFTLTSEYITESELSTSLNITGTITPGKCSFKTESFNKEGNINSSVILSGS